MGPGSPGHEHPSEVRIEVRAAGVNPVDWKIRQGLLREVMPLDMPAGLGREAAGTVRAVGRDVTDLAIGDEVFGNVAPISGGIAETALLRPGRRAGSTAVEERVRRDVVAWRPTVRASSSTPRSRLLWPASSRAGRTAVLFLLIVVPGSWSPPVSVRWSRPAPPR